MKHVAALIGKVLLAAASLALAIRGGLALYWRTFGKATPAAPARGSSKMDKFKDDLMTGPDTPKAQAARREVIQDT